MLNSYVKRGFSRLVYCKQPYIRNKTLGGVEFDVQMQVQSKEQSKHGIENKTWTMVNKATGSQMSPWHDIEIESATAKEHCITGVIEMSARTHNKLECIKEIAHNPIMQDVSINKNTKQHELRKFSQPAVFNYGFIPRTWSDNENGGDGDPIDLVDLSWRDLKPVMAVSDFLVLGALGLIDQGELDIKILAIEINEALERGITSLTDFEKQQPGKLSDIKAWFRDYKTWEGLKENKFSWGGEIKPAEFALDLIRQSQHEYQALRAD